MLSVAYSINPESPSNSVLSVNLFAFLFQCSLINGSLCTAFSVNLHMSLTSNDCWNMLYIASESTISLGIKVTMVRLGDPRQACTSRLSPALSADQNNGQCGIRGGFIPR